MNWAINFAQSRSGLTRRVELDVCFVLSGLPWTCIDRSAVRSRSVERAFWLSEVDSHASLSYHNEEYLWVGRVRP